MWGRLLAATETIPKHHYFIANVSACNLVQVSNETYIAFNNFPSRKECCEKCIKDLQDSGVIRNDDP